MSGEDYTGSSGVMDRRKFLKLSGVGLAGTALLLSVGAVDGLAQTRTTLMDEVREAAKKYRIPVSLLLAMSYVNTRWEMPPPDANEYEPGDLHGWGSYGIMQLVQNPFSDTLAEASKLTGISEEKLKTDRRSNILGGAALLASSQGARPAILGNWYGAVSGKGGSGKSYEAVAGVGAGELYAEQVFETLKKGARAKTRDGEEVSLAAKDLSARVTDQEEVL